MSGLLLLGVVSGRKICPAITPPHQRLDGDGYAAILLSLDRLPSDPSSPEWAMQAALAQNAILSAYAATEDVIPVALGAAFTGIAAVRRHLDAERATLDTKMGRLAGRAEYLVQLFAEQIADPGAPAPASGSAFLKARSARHDQRRHLARERAGFARATAQQLASLSCSAWARPLKPDGPLLDLSLLVVRERVPVLLKAAQACSRGGSHLALSTRLIGPCAPFSFLAEPCGHE
ncbi:GvpL/GvpF family gas vesicle protein [Cereibacter sphaeroides]|uniref:GvpL/GvpF family gas vesicle protein n=1 Tax=Cereibacter sphaeroides TaxID=1063 RepID=UPI000191C9EE|nr:GvpL/GvpF family gas vesicle protein [Cereibacter sphaeroides]ACM03605.1 Gas vesicle operon protein [Cereibacter sphaeroides KD131]